MNSALRTLVDRYDPKTASDWENALREIVQELALLGLWRAKFYEHAAFYGGTSLRIFHQLPRFSEDMDFTLLQPNGDFDLSPYLNAVSRELASFGFEFDVERKEKRIETAIDSAFIKGNTLVNILEIGAPKGMPLAPSKKVKIKLEVDTDPPGGEESEMHTLLVPIPFQVRLCTMPCLFAGKLHALLCRNWKTRVKGRDFFDFVWYLGRETPVQRSHLQARLVQTGHWEADRDFEIDALRSLLRQRFETVDYDQAKAAVSPFIRDLDHLALWSEEFFVALTERIEAV